MCRSRGLLVSLLVLLAAGCGGAPAATAGRPATVASAAPNAPPSAGAETEVPVVPTGSAQVRGLWVDAFHEGIKSPKQVDTLIKRAHQGNLNALFVQVRKRGDAYYLKGLEPVASDIDYPGHPNWDPLGYLIQKAHTANPPLEVHAWMNTFFVGQTSQVFLDSGSQWGNLMEDGTNGGYGYLDPGIPAVRAYTQDVMAEVVRRYNVDGIHMDFVRYPDGGNWGYSALALQRYAADTGRGERPAPGDPAFQQWRRDQVTDFVRGLHARIQAIRPRVKLSGALIAYGPGPKTESDWQGTRTYNDVYQDWLTWMRLGYIDLAVPMNYDRDSSPSQLGWFRSWTAWEKDHQGRARLLVGVGAFLNYPEDSMTQIRAALAPTASGNRPAGIAIYSYASTSLYGTDDFYLSPGDLGYLPRQPYTSNSDPVYLATRAKEFNLWFFTALSAPSSYQDPALGKVATTPVFTAPAPLPASG